MYLDKRHADCTHPREAVHCLKSLQWWQWCQWWQLWLLWQRWHWWQKWQSDDSGGQWGFLQKVLAKKYQMKMIKMDLVYWLGPSLSMTSLTMSKLTMKMKMTWMTTMTMSKVDNEYITWLTDCQWQWSMMTMTQVDDDKDRLDIIPGWLGWQWWQYKKLTIDNM